MKKNFMIVLLILIFLFSFSSIMLFSYKKLSKYSIAIVMSDSMTPVLNKYDLIIIKKQDEYNESDIVAYYENNNIIVHRIILKGNNYVITKGDANKVDDNKIKLKNLKGKVIRNFNYAGKIVVLLQKRNIRIILYVVLTLSIILTNSGFNKKR